MTLFIDTRLLPVGGEVAALDQVRLIDETGQSFDKSKLASAVSGQHVIIGTHGFNVQEKDGLNGLHLWGDSLCLPNGCIFVGALWPGNSQFIPVIDYPIELTTARDAGDVLAQYLDANCAEARSVSFVSHSLGALLVLEALSSLPDRWDGRIGSITLMAGAVDADCLTNAYAKAVKRVKRVNVIASEFDHVLGLAYPAGNPFGELIMLDWPELKKALGYNGPSPSLTAIELGQITLVPAGQQNENWKFDHGDYLPSVALAPWPDPASLPADPALNAAPPDDPTPTGSLFGGGVPWKPRWTSGMTSADYIRQFKDWS